MAFGAVRRWQLCVRSLCDSVVWEHLFTIWGNLGEALPVAWLFLSLKVSGVDFLDFGLDHTGIGTPASWERSVPLSAVNSTSALLSASGGCVALNLLLLFISHTVVVLPLPRGGSGPSII